MRGRGDQSRMQYDGAPNARVYADGRAQPATSMQPMDLVSPELGGMAQVKPQRQSRKKVSKPGNGGDALVFMAMGLVSAALGLGLYAHIGIDLPVALIAAAGLFVSTSFLHVFVRRMQGVDLLDRRVTALEETVLRFDGSEKLESNTAAPAQLGQSEDDFAFEDLRTTPGLERAENPEDWSQVPQAQDASEALVEPRLAATPKPEPIELPPAYQIPQDAAAGFGMDAGASARPLADPIYDLAQTSSSELDARSGVGAPRAEVGAADAAGSPRDAGREVQNTRNAEPSHAARSIDGLVRQLSAGMSGAAEATGAGAPLSDVADHPPRPDVDGMVSNEAAAESLRST